VTHLGKRERGPLIGRKGSKRRHRAAESNESAAAIDISQHLEEASVVAIKMNMLMHKDF